MVYRAQPAQLTAKAELPVEEIPQTLHAAKNWPRGTRARRNGTGTYGPSRESPKFFRIEIVGIEVNV